MILAGTDFHGDEEAIRRFGSKAEEVKAEVLVICGDITHFGSVQEAKDLLMLLVELRLPSLFVPGNCDPPSLVGVDVEGAYCLHGKYRSYGDVTFLGIGGGPVSPFNTPFEMTEEEINDLLARESERSSINRWFILISHTPPKNTKIDRTHSGKHIGSESIRRFIRQRRPSLVFCGHVHEADGTDKIDGTVLVNPGPARHGKCVLVWLNKEIEVQLDYL